MIGFITEEFTDSKPILSRDFPARLGRCYNDLPHVATEGDMSKTPKRRLDHRNDSLRKRRLLLRQGMGASQLDCQTEVSTTAIFNFISLIVPVSAYASV